MYTETEAVWAEDGTFAHIVTETDWLRPSDAGGTRCIFTDMKFFESLRTDEIRSIVGNRHLVVWTRSGRPRRPCEVWLSFTGRAIIQVRESQDLTMDSWPTIRRVLEETLSSLTIHASWPSLYMHDDGGVGLTAEAYAAMCECETRIARIAHDVCAEEVRRARLLALRVRRAKRIIRGAVAENLERIKARLWRPDGILVARMFEDISI